MTAMKKTNGLAIVGIFAAIMTWQQVSAFAPQPGWTLPPQQAASHEALVKLKVYENNNRNHEYSMEDDSTGSAESPSKPSPSPLSRPQQAGGDDSSLPNNHNNNNNNKYKFAFGRDLELLRAELDNVRKTLQWAQASGDQDRITYLSEAIAMLEVRDPDIAYAKALAEQRRLRNYALTNASESQNEEIEQQIDYWMREAALARSCLSRFQMEGLWVGNYGIHGLELINVTYDGDTLFARKVTGVANVPRGRVTFTADLTPKYNRTTTMLLPLEVFLTNMSYKHPSPQDRFSGKGQIARPKFKESKFIDGQLIVWKDSFSFVWIGLAPQTSETAGYNNNKFHQVHFCRPTPEQIISLLRNVLSQEDELDNMREHLSRCLDMDVTESLVRHHANGGKVESFRRISTREELEALDQCQQKAAARVLPNDARPSSPTPAAPTELKSVVNDFVSSIQKTFIPLNNDDTEERK